MFEQVERIPIGNGDHLTVIYWHGTEHYETVPPAALRKLQAQHNEFVPDDPKARHALLLGGAS